MIKFINIFIKFFLTFIIVNSIIISKISAQEKNDKLNADKKDLKSQEVVKTVDGRLITISENGTCSISENKNNIYYEIKSYKKGELFPNKCEFLFKIENNTNYGTMYRAELSAHAINDKGEKISVGSGLAKHGELTNIEPLKIGNSSVGVFLVDSKCKYIKKIEIDNLFPSYCEIRNLPEEVNCYNLVKIKNLTNINFEKL
ncbi:MAG: hypothetical protein CL661_02940 [Bacteroidetes bacterium]|nr:hypothetical protein [Bacteroidota bacterium]